jgi:2,3-bisphosphoglycerate-independent phosphoglycerate mutase
MVGHSGKLNATIKAVEAVDDCLGNIYNAIMDINGEILITADHGNAEKMFDIKTLEAHTAHTNNSVPLIYVGKRKASLKDSETGSLSDIAPTILHMMGIEKPKEMEGNSLISFE